MSANLEVTVTVKQDGKILAGFPLYRRVQVDEVQQFHTEQATGSGFVSVPSGELGTVHALVLRPSRAVTVRFANQSDAGLVVQASGLLLVLDALIGSGATTNIKVDNASGATAILEGLAGGT